MEGLGLCAELRAFATLLVDENRTSCLPEIRDQLQELVDQAAGPAVHNSAPLGCKISDFSLPELRFSSSVPNRHRLGPDCRR